MKQKTTLLRMVSGMLMAVTLFTSVMAPLSGFAAEDTMKETDLDSYVSSLPELMEVKDQLERGEVVEAEDLEIALGDPVDFTKEFPRITFDKEKVKVSFYQAVDETGKAFTAEKAGTYQAVYYAEPKSGNPAYRFSRKVSVKEAVTSKASERKTDVPPDRAGEETGTGSTDSRGTEEESPGDRSDNTAASAVTEAGATEKSHTKREPDTEEDEGFYEEEEAPVLEDSPFDVTKSDELSYDLLYFAEHANDRYVNVENIDLLSMVQPVTVARGVASYNVGRQKEFSATEANFLAAVDYEVPVYDIDKDSAYYVAKPSVNLYSREFGSYDLMLAYNNNQGETISGYHFEDNILYIPKDVVDDPKAEYGYINESPIAIQLNYFIKGGIDTDDEGNADFSKTIPVQILMMDEDEPASRAVRTANMFDTDLVVPDVVKEKGAYETSDFTVMLNGMMMPVREEVYDYDSKDGTLTIHSTPAMVSSVNIVVKNHTKAKAAALKLKDIFCLPVYAVTQDDMAYFKTENNKYVTLNADLSDLYVGWRGYYENGSVQFSGRSTIGDHSGTSEDESRIKKLMSLKGWQNAVKYLYGGYVPGDQFGDGNPHAIVSIWAISSYTVGENRARGLEAKLTADGKVVDKAASNDSGSTGSKTIYEWMIQYAKNLERSNGQMGNTKAGNQGGYKNSNGIGGYTNFAFKFPKNIKGSDKNLVPTGFEDHGKGNPDIRFESDEIDSSYYLAASCTHLNQAEGSDDEGSSTVYVSCLGIGSDYAIFAFSTSDARGDGQTGNAIYKFKTGSSIKLKKESSNSGISKDNACYDDLSGAKYGLYESSSDAASDKDRAATFTTDKDGETNEVSVVSGTYYVKELKAPANYALKADTVKITVTGKSSVQTFKMADAPQNNPLDIVLVKVDKETGKAEPQGGGSLAGAEFTVKYYDNEKGSASGTPKKTWVLKTDAKGEAHLKDSYKVSGDAFYKDSSGKCTLPVGTYSIQETKAPAGYVAADTAASVQVVTAKGTAESVSAFVTKDVPNQIIRGGVQIKKEDTITEGTPQGDADFSGISFEITNESRNSVSVDGKLYAKGSVVKTIVTDKDGIAKTGNRDLPYGSYTIKEVRTNSSYLLTDGKAKSFQIREDGRIVEISEPFKDEVVRGDVEIEKLDRETDVRVPLGSATHVGTTFEITNKSIHPVVVDGKLFQVGEVCKTIRIEKEKETAKTTGRALPYGTYTIREVAVGQGYLLTDTKERTFQIREDGKTVSVSKDGDVKEPFRNQVKRGDFNFIKVFEDADSDRNMNSLAYIPFEIISKTTGEKHIIVTDENGQFDSENNWYAHSKNTNANDSAVRSDGTVDEEKLTSEAGVWFDTDREGNKAKKVDDTLGALPYDTYTMNELSCKANEGAKLVKNRTFTIRVDKRNVSLGTVDDPADKSIGTVALDGETKDHIGSSVSETIIDTVSYKGLTEGQKYTMKGTLIDKETEEAVVVSGKKVTAKESFIAAGTSGEVEMQFVFPKNALKGKQVVVFETCESDGKIIASHEDIEDEDQTVSYPDIETEAKDGKTENHFGLNESTTIIDKVSYVNLKPGKEYRLKGTLMDKATGEAILDEGKEITAEKKFTPSESNGEIELLFEFPAGILTGKSVVAFETCYQEEREIAIHTDINDEDQTVCYPDIRTEARDGHTGTHYGASSSTTLIDSVSYMNLEPGKEYVMKGTIMDKATGEALLSEGKEITAEEKFTPSQKDGAVELTFEFPSDLLKGKTVVAFETCNQEDKEIAVHADIEDEAQTVYYPEIGTTLTDDKTDDHIAATGKTITLTDTVSYKNFEAGREYTMAGRLMDKSTGKALLQDGKEVTAEMTFVPEAEDGSVDLKFTVNMDKLNGKTLVAFETATSAYAKGKHVGKPEDGEGEASNNMEDKVIAVHEDINDEGQSVHVPDIATNAVDKDTKSHTGKVQDTATIEDKVTYKNLIPGKKYTMVGTLMDKKSGKALKDSAGRAFTQTKEFTPEKAEGTVTLSFNVPGELVGGKSIVAFESCKLDKVEVAVHADLSDKDQTVIYPKKKEATPSTSTRTPSGKGSTPSSGSGNRTTGGTSVLSRFSPKTGDSNNLALWIGILFAAGAALTGFCLARKRHKKDHQG